MPQDPSQIGLPFGHTPSRLRWFPALALLFMVLGPLAPELTAQEVLTVEQRQWLDAHPRLRLAPDPDFPPFEFFDDAGQYRGIAADYVRLIEKKIHAEFEILRLPSWDDVIAGTKAKEVDVLAAAMESPQRTEYLNFSSPHIELPGVIIVNDDGESSLSLEDLHGQKVAVVSGYVWQDLLSEDHPEIDLVRVPDIQSGLRRVSFGEVDALVGDPATATHYIEREAITNLRIAGDSDYRYRLAFAVRADWPELHAILETAVRSITEAERQQIINRWIHVTTVESRMWKRVGVAALVFLVGLVAVLIWNWALRSQVTQRTRELVEELAARQRTEAERAAAVVANRAKSEFLANTSHEIRTPMTAILGYADILLDEDEPPEKKAEAAATIRRNGEHLLSILNDILDLSKLEAGRLEVEEVEVCPLDLMIEVATLMEVRAQAKGVALEVEIEGRVPGVIRTDPTRLRQILVNIVGNAMKFTEEGSVRVTCVAPDPPEELLCFDIRDTGIGMSEEQMTRLFQPFVQADASTTRKYGGTGLGLTISRRLANMLGGDIVACCEPGRGCCFRTSVSTGPLVDVKWVGQEALETRGADLRSNPQTASRSRLDGVSVLYAEDGPDNQRLISHVLIKAGADVTLVENGRLAVEEALSRWSEDRAFDVILMDMQMPVMDGYEATRELRGQEYPGPVVALTANAMSTDREKCLAAGCNDFATKPIDRVALVDLLRELVDERITAG